jgi:hypothetical protein
MSCARENYASSPISVYGISTGYPCNFFPGVCIVRVIPLWRGSEGEVQCGIHTATRKDDDHISLVAGAYSSPNFVSSCLYLICGVLCVCIACSLLV